MDAEEGDLDIDEGPPGETKPDSALARARAISLALSDAARRTRISSRRRLSSGGFENRRGAALARALLVGSFIALCALPTLLAFAYFGYFAADQYVTEAEFTVSAGESPFRDGVESLSGAPMQLILQDTQIIMNFLHSREIVDRLEAQIGLRKIYSREGADWLARFDPDKSVERLVKYWSSVASVSVKLPGGLVKLKVRAFSPRDTKAVGDATLALCEELVNSLNARINRDAVALAEASMNRATERLTKTLAAQETARDESGVLEANMSAHGIDALLQDLKSSLLHLSADYNTQLRYMKADTAQMRDLKTRIDVLKRQIAKVEGELTTAPGTVAARPEKTVAAAMTKLGQLDIEQKADEQLYANAATALEHARVAADYQLIYLKVFARPRTPQESEYPARGLDILLVAASSLALWGLLVAIGAAVRNNMA